MAQTAIRLTDQIF